MAHTTKVNNTNFIHNSDLSGDVEILNKKGNLLVNGDDLIEFVVEYFRDKKINQIEQMETSELIEKIVNVSL